MHRQNIHRGRVSYEPNSLGGGCPFQAGKMAGFTSFPQPVEADKVRGKPEKFADHYTQAALFYQSQTPVEQAHIVRALRFELTKVQVPAIRARVVSQLVHVDADLAARVAEGLGIEVPKAQEAVVPKNNRPEVKNSPALSLMARPGDGSVRTRRVAILVADGVDVAAAQALHAALLAEGAVPRFVGPRLGEVRGGDGADLEVEISLEAGPSVLFDALSIPDGAAAAQELASLGQALEFVKDTYRHCKPILAVGAGRQLVESAQLPAELPSGEPDPGLLVAEAADDGVRPFIAAIAKHRVWERQTDPPRV
jgi:catalase